MLNPIAIHRCTRVSLAWLLLVAAAGNAFAQGTPAVARATRWDIHAVTGGATAPAEGTHKLSGIARDTTENVWVLGQGAGNVRVGRIDTASEADATYTEWKVFKYGEDGEPRSLLVTPANDVWMAVGGIVPFVRKLAGSNTFLNFRRDGSLLFSPRAMTMAADGSKIFVAGAEETGQGYIVTIATSLGAAPDVTLPAWTAPPDQRHRFQPQYIAIDRHPTVVWFTNSGAPMSPVSTVTRLDVATGRMLEWSLTGLAAAGLHVSGSRVCVVTRGSLSQPPAPAGDVECLLIPEDHPGTPANEMATTAARRQRFNRTAAGALDLPEQIMGTATDLFVSEPGGNALVFIGAPASAAVVEDYVPPMSLQLEQAPLGGFRVQNDWEGPNQPRLSVSLPSAAVSLAGEKIGTGQVRFGFPAEPQQHLEPLMRQPHPTAMTPVFLPNGPGGAAAMYVAESFHGLRGDTYLAGRIDRIEVPAAPVITVTDALGNSVSTLSFSADVGAAPSAALTRQLSISNGGPGTLDWVATATGDGFSMTVAPVTSGVVSGSASSSITLTPTVPDAPGPFTGSLTISSPSTVDSVVIPVTFTVNGPPLLTANRTQLTFQTNRLLAASDTVQLTNAPYRTALTWEATSPSWLTLGPGHGVISGGQQIDVTAAVNTAGLPVNVPQTASLTFFDPADPTATNTRVVLPVTVTVTAPTIVIGQASVAFPPVLQGATSSQAVTLSNAGSGPLNPTIAVTPGATWLGASLSGSTPIPAGESRTLTVAVDTVGLSTGTTHTATITVSDPAAADLPLYLFQPAQQITVSVEATPSGQITLLFGGTPVSPTTPIALEVIKGVDTEATRSFQVTNTGSGSFEYLATATTETGGAWLTIDGSPSAVVSTTQAGTLTLKFTNFPAPGVYDAQVALTLTSGRAGNAPLTLPVRLTVKGSALSVAPAAVYRSVRRGQTASASITVENVGDGPLNFTATASGNITPGGTPWFTLAAGYSGTLDPHHPDRMTAVVMVRFNTAAKGDFAGGLITVTDSMTSRTVTIPVELHVAGRPELATSGVPLRMFEWNATSGAADQVIQVRNTGDATLNAHVTATVPWLRFSWPSGAQSIGEHDSTPLAISIEPQFLPGVGIHTGQVTIQDPAAPGATTTFTVTLKVAAPAQLVLSPLSLTFVMRGGQDLAPQVVTMSNPGGLPLNVALDVTTADGTPWLVVAASATHVAPQGAATLTVRPVAAALSAGTYTGTITVRDHAAGVAGTVAVTLTITGGGGLVIAPTQLTFDATRWTVCNGSTSGSNPASQSVVITNDSDRPVWYLVAPSTASGVPWLSVSPSGGVVPPGKTRTVSVSVDAKSLAHGAYAGTLTVYTLTNPSNSYVIDSHLLPVALNVGPAPARMCVSPASLDFGSLKQHNLSATKMITIENVGDGDLAWSAAATASDGTVTLSKAGSTLRVAVRAGTKKGSQTGKVTISARGVPSQFVTLKWSVAEKKGGGDDDDDEDHDHDHDHDHGGCHGDHDRDGDHDDDDHRRHRHGYDRD